jgi:hypothetical protein
MIIIELFPGDIDENGNKLAKDLFDEGIESLIKWLPEYDMGYWFVLICVRCSIIRK